MLLFIKAAEGVKHIARNHTRARKFAFHFANSRTEIAAANPRRHRDHALEIIAHDFRLAGNRGEGGHAFQRKQVSVGRAQEEIVDLTNGFAGVARNPNTHADELRPFLNARGHVAG